MSFVERSREIDILIKKNNFDRDKNFIILT